MKCQKHRSRNNCFADLQETLLQKFKKQDSLALTLRGNTNHDPSSLSCQPKEGRAGGFGYLVRVPAPLPTEPKSDVLYPLPGQDLPGQDLDRMYPTPFLPRQDLPGWDQDRMYPTLSPR